MADAKLSALPAAADITAADELYLNDGGTSKRVTGTTLKGALESGGGVALSVDAAQVGSGTLTHERGGLEADASAYDGLVKISGGSTSAAALPLTHENGGLEADVSAYDGLVEISGGSTSAAALPLTHENGGLEADVSAYSGLVKISGGSTSEAVAGTDYAATRSGVNRTIWIDAGAMVPRTTNGAAAATEEYATNDIMMDHFLFDNTTKEAVQFKLAMPDVWDRSTVKAKVYWDAATSASASDVVTWGVSAGALSNDDAIDAALGTEVDVDDTVIAVGDLHVSAATGAITVGGSPALGDMIVFQVARDVAGNDDMTEDAKLLGVAIQYGESSTEPSAW